jgi:hypothetical protein
MHETRNNKRRKKYRDYVDTNNTLWSKTKRWVPGAPEILVITDDMELDSDLTKMTKTKHPIF